MIKFESQTLSNGLRVVMHQDKSVNQVVLNILYDVGSRDEDPTKTGFAHLFEHLMFGGSKNITDYDTPLQRVGGENNAFTSPDITNYYLSVPSANIETGFWLESDRMMSLSFDPEVLEVQRKVVIEEFKQRYLNQPYGDVSLMLREMAYTKHPYQWPTIGKEISHIEKATMEDVKEFFFKHYRPNNAILVIAGNFEFDEAKRLTEKWFGDIPAGPKVSRNLPQEPKQTAARRLSVERDVPLEALYLTFHVPGKSDKKYHQADLLSDILGRGKSSRLYQQLVRERQLFSSIHAYQAGSYDPGLLTIDAKLNAGVDAVVAEAAIWEVLNDIKDTITEAEVQRVKNQAEATVVFGAVELLNRAMSLAFDTVLGDTNMINTEVSDILAVTKEQIANAAKDILRVENSCTLNYKVKN